MSILKKDAGVGSISRREFLKLLSVDSYDLRVVMDYYYGVSSEEWIYSFACIISGLFPFKIIYQISLYPHFL